MGLNLLGLGKKIEDIIGQGLGNAGNAAEQFVGMHPTFNQPQRPQQQGNPGTVNQINQATGFNNSPVQMPQPAPPQQNPFTSSLVDEGNNIIKGTPFLKPVIQGVKAVNNASFPVKPFTPPGQPATPVTVGDVARQLPGAAVKLAGDATGFNTIAQHAQQDAQNGANPVTGFLGALGDVGKGFAQFTANPIATGVATAENKPVNVPVLGQYKPIGQQVQEQGLLPTVDQQVLGALSLLGGAKGAVDGGVKLATPSDSAKIAATKSAASSPEPFTRMVSPEELTKLQKTGQLPANSEGYTNLINPGGNAKVPSNKTVKVSISPDVAQTPGFTTTEGQSAVKGPIDSQHILDIEHPAPSVTAAETPKVSLGTHDTVTPQEMKIGKALGMNRDQVVLAKQEIQPQQNVFENKVAMDANADNFPTNEIPLKAQGTNPVVKTLGSKSTIVRKQGPYGQALDALVNKQINEHQIMSADIIKRTPTVWKLNKSEFSEFADAAHGRIPIPSSSKIQQALTEWQSVAPDVQQRGVKAGLDIGNVQDYFPKEYDKSVFSDRSKYNQSLRYLIKSGQANSLEDAVRLMKDYRDNLRLTQYGHFKSRGIELPQEFELKNKDVLARYVSGSSRAITQAENFGAHGMKLDRLIGRIAESGHDAKTAQTAVERFLRTPFDDSATAQILKGVREAESASRLGKAALSHAGQTVQNTATETGVIRTLGGWVKSLNSADRDFAKSTGVISEEELRGLRSQAGYEGLAGKVTAPGLTTLMKQNRIVSAIAGRDWGNALARAGKTDTLDRLGVTGPIGKKLTPAQEVQAARGVVRDTMFRHTPWDTPLWAETAGGKTVGQFRMAYAYKQPKFVYEQVIKEAGRGNIAPLLRFMTLGLATGYAVVLGKNAVSGRKESTKDTIIDTISGLGGLPGELAAQGRYLGSNPIGTIAGAVAPLAGEAVGLAKDIGSAAQGNPKQLEKNTIKRLPLVGNRIANTVFPPASPEAIAYATAVNKALGSLPKPDRDQLAAYLSRQKDNQGKTIQEEPKDSQKNADILYGNDAARQALAKAQRSLPNHDPMWDLSDADLKTLMAYRKNYSGDAQQAVIAQRNPWINDLLNKQQQFYGGLSSTAVPSQFDKEHPRPNISPSTQALLGQMDNLDSASRASLFKQHPELSDAIAQLEAYTNAKRVNEGGLALKTSSAADPQTQKILDAYNALPKGNGPNGSSPARSAWIKANPAAWAKMTSYLSQSSVISLIRNVAKAQFEGTDLNQTALKDIKNVGQYDVVTNPNGSLALAGSSQAAPGALNSSETAYNKQRAARVSSSANRASRNALRRSVAKSNKIRLQYGTSKYPNKPRSYAVGSVSSGKPKRIATKGVSRPRVSLKQNVS